MAVSFAAKIKPYFTQDDRDSMIDPDHTGGYTVDLWSRDDCESNFDAIKGAIDSGGMPPGGWPQDQINAFDADFDAWKSGGFQP